MAKIDERYGRDTAERVGKIIVQVAQALPNCPLKKVFLYGSIAFGSGRDIDLILEVDRDTFEEYVGQCVTVLDGLRPFSDDLLERFHGAYWGYFSPKVGRSKAAIETIGVSIEELNLEVPKEALDIICLPEGWDDEDSDTHRSLNKRLQGIRDSTFIKNAMSSSVQIFPSV